MKTAKKFALDINLDDKEEVNSFILAHNTTRGRTLSNRLGFRGKGATKLANAFSNYAWNKKVAIKCREEGDIAYALKAEAICDSIYSNDINPVCDCW